MAANKFCHYIISLGYSKTEPHLPALNRICNKEIAVHSDEQNKLSKWENMQVFAASNADVAM